MASIVRVAAAEDLAGLPAIELSGEAMFAAYGIVFPPGPATIEGAIAHGAEILVVGDPPVAFAALIDVDGHPHLEQISVRADRVHHGIGSLLLDEVVRGCGPGLTLITFRDVPWNGPWYLRHGFTELPPAAWGPQLRDHWQAEIDVGLHDLGPRIVMFYPLRRRAPAGP
jgi:GNAT superfamily N-acetyltransferase